ncbi:MAG: adenosylmethionine-8-amino-7-oxononanoate aminotransferase, partial [Spirosoma sp.]|nr:adenosylmethionine-8-amino-7-oxononanoate aminotransferase [Spirosoma sp.]
DETQTSIQRISAQHAQFVNRLAYHLNVTSIRQCGTLLAFDVNVGEQTSYFNSIRDKAYSFLLERGILMRPLGNVLYLMPPYCTTDAQLTYVYEQVEELLRELKQVPQLTGRVVN